MSEAVGSLYELAAGIEPLTPGALPRASTIAAASVRPVAEPAIAWSVVLPDRVEGLKADATFSSAPIFAHTHDGSMSQLREDGGILVHMVGKKGDELRNVAPEMKPPVDAVAIAEAQKAAPPQRLVKFVATAGDLTAVAHWGGWLALRDRTGALKAARQFEQDITALAVAGENLIVGDADGRVTALKLQP